jgi:hypothetical protein
MVAATDETRMITDRMRGLTPAVETKQRREKRQAVTTVTPDHDRKNQETLVQKTLSYPHPEL